MAEETTNNSNMGGGIKIPFSVSFLNYNGELDKFFDDYREKAKEASKDANQEFIKAFKVGKDKIGVSFAQVGENQYKEVISYLTQGGKISTRNGKPRISMGDFIYSGEEVMGFNLASTSWNTYKNKRSKVPFQREQAKINAQNDADKKERAKTERFETRAEKRLWSKDWDDLVGSVVPKEDKQREKLAGLRHELSRLKQEYMDLREQGKPFEEIEKQVESVKSEIKDLQDEMKLTFGQKLWNTFKRVGFYRLARGFFAFIQQGFSESLKSLSAFSPEINKTMSSITSQFSILSNSIINVVMPLLKVVEPILTAITRTVAELSNSISYFIAKLTGSAKYIKVNTDYLKDFNNQLNTLSFDKFEALSQGDGSSNMFTEVETSEGLTDEMSGALVTLSEISALLLAMGSYKMITWITSGDAKKFFTDLKDSLGKVKTKIDNISAAGLIASTTFAFVASLINLIDVIKNWDSQSLITKITAIMSAVLALASVIFAVLAAIPGIGAASVFKAISVGLTAGAILTGAVSVMKFEKGGMVPNGTLFYAGENGKAEAVTQMPNGQTGVTNIEQFEEASSRALFGWWAVAKYDIPSGDVVLDVDGAEIARSKRLKYEFNRTNPGLNLR